MNKILVFILIVCFGDNAFAQVFKNNQPLEIKGAIYNVEAKLLNKDSDTSNERIVEVDFYMISNDKGNYKAFEQAGSYEHMKKVFVFNRKYKNKKTINLLSKISTNDIGPLRNYTRCYIKVFGEEINFNLSNGIGSEKILFTLYKEFSYLATEEKPKSTSEKNAITTVPEEQDSADKKSETLAAAKPRETYAIHLVGDIDSKKFPRNERLENFLRNNTDFIFRLTMDLYLDILRFSADSVDYDNTKVTNFLAIHDLMYVRYAFNESKLNQKVNACIKLLRQVNAIYSRGDVFYKDYKVELSKKDVISNPITLVQYEPQKDDFYDAKRVKGELDWFYSENGLNVYLTNWTSMSSTKARSVYDTYLTCLNDSTQELTLRIYFIIQPLAAYSKKGIFKGVTAYGLKGILFIDCPSNFISSIDNIYSGNIMDKEVGDMYREAISYLQRNIKHSGISDEVNPKAIEGKGYYLLGDWRQFFEDCEVGFVFWSGRVSRLPSKDAIISLKMLTNMGCAMQPGNNMTFTNRFTDVSFTVPLVSATLIKNESSGDYYNVTAQVSPEVLASMIEANVNSVSCGCTDITTLSAQSKGTAITAAPFNAITHRVERLTAPVDVDENGWSEKLISLLKKGLQ